MRILSFLFLILLIFSSCSATTPFDKYFTHQALRLDFILGGDAKSSHAYYSALYCDPIWGGSQSQLIDSSGFGQYRVVMTDALSGDTIYSSGFCTLFQEWQSTPEASQMPRAFQQSVQMPFPRKATKVMVQERQPDLFFRTILTVPVDPQSPSIIRDVPSVGAPVDVEIHGKAANCVDLVFVAEGYTASEQDKFISDVKRLCDYLFTFEPYRQKRQKFNVRALKVVSPQGGTDNPRRNEWVNTPFSAGFNALGIDRYLLTEEVFKLRKAAAKVPYDQVILLVNSPLYGGAGIYNHFMVVTSDHPQTLPVFVHEFGHAFAGLADEYYDSEVSYSDFIDKKTEPWYPNITTLVDFSKKWKNRVDASTPIPTPVSQEYRMKIGAFEGAAYSAHGIYRPFFDCRMKTNDAPAFCPVCQLTIESIIHQLSQ